MDDQRFDSSSDDRTANNSVRHKYRKLSDAERADMIAIKTVGAAFIEKLHLLGSSRIGADNIGSRQLNAARDHMELAVMRAVQHITA